MHMMTLPTAMKTLLALSVLSFCVSADPKLSDFEALGPRGKMRRMADFDAKVVLIVNVASKCGFTKQYSGLQALHDQYKSQGFNEPGTNREINKFARETFKVRFPILGKTTVNGPEAIPLFKYLTEATTNEVPKAGWNPGLPEKDVQWNFTKFLLVNGVLVKRYSFDVEPAQLKEDIEKVFSDLKQDDL